MDYLAKKIGSYQIGDNADKGKVAFNIYFPKEKVPDNIKSIKVVGDFQKELGQTNWDEKVALELKPVKQNDNSVIWSGETPKELKSGFYEYKYYVTFDDESRLITDPCARYGGSKDNNSGFVVGGSSPAQNEIKPLKSGRKPVSDLIMYELMIDDFTDEFRGNKSPIEAVVEKLDYLEKELGVNAILFMPWTAWPDNNFNWGYTPYLYFAVEYRYANSLNKPEEKLSWLKKLINECHKRDIHVIMDGVFNHVSPMFPYRDFYKNRDECPFTDKSFGGKFDGLQDLNFNNECTQEFVRDVSLYWIKNFKIDGIRFDNTVNFYVDQEVKGLPKLIQDIKDYLKVNKEENFSLTLEHINMSAVEATKIVGANSYWDNGLYDKTFNYLWNGNLEPELLNVLNNKRFVKNSDIFPTIYLSNHDHSHVNWQAGAKDNLGSMNWYKTQPYVIAMLTSPGSVLIQNGQEFGEDHWIMEDDRGSGRRVQPRALRWSFKNDKIGDQLLKLYNRMIEIRKKYPALRSENFYPEYQEGWQKDFNPQGYGVNKSKQVVIYHRWNNANNKTVKFIIALNFSSSDQYVTVPFPDNGNWVDLLSNYKGDWSVNINNFKLDLKIGSFWGHVFYKEV
jgi:1,4-alpha-glucan branching enzyme